MNLLDKIALLWNFLAKDYQAQELNYEIVVDPKSKDINHFPFMLHKDETKVIDEFLFENGDTDALALDAAITVEFFDFICNVDLSYVRINASTESHLERKAGIHIELIEDSGSTKRHILTAVVPTQVMNVTLDIYAMDAGILDRLDEFLGLGKFLKATYQIQRKYLGAPIKKGSRRVL
nr:MAG TPA: hypothetical protein [Caudoviricetes sp.]